jgi:hypothetical protein
MVPCSHAPSALHCLFAFTTFWHAPRPPTPEGAHQCPASQGSGLPSEGGVQGSPSSMPVQLALPRFWHVPDAHSAPTLQPSLAFCGPSTHCPMPETVAEGTHCICERWYGFAASGSEYWHA